MLLGARGFSGRVSVLTRSTLATRAGLGGLMRLVAPAACEPIALVRREEGREKSRPRERSMIRAVWVDRGSTGARKAILTPFRPAAM